MARFHTLVSDTVFSFAENIRRAYRKLCDYTVDSVSSKVFAISFVQERNLRGDNRNAFNFTAPIKQFVRRIL